MFSKAYKIASHFTHPVINSVLHYDNDVNAGCASFIILNEEGWIITVSHIFESYFLCKAHEKEIKEHCESIDKIKSDPKFNAKKKKKRISHLNVNPKWIKKQAYWWGSDGAVIKDVHIIKDVDLAVGRLEPFNPEGVNNYPVLKNPSSNLDQGTSLCRLGFPLYEISASYDSKTDQFILPDGTLPIPRFPIEGIYTRNIIVGKSSNLGCDIKFIETSSPGLKGQSGGPIFDVQGTVWAVQSMTKHFPLGFSPKVKRKGKEVIEYQFLNAGWGIHPETLVAFLNKYGVKFKISDY